MTHELRFDAERNVILFGERRLVFHCHHYNVFLQRSIEDMIGADGVAIQVAAAAESAREMLSRLLADAGPTVEARLGVAQTIFGENGFGHADVQALRADGGSVVLATSHYATGWRAKWGSSPQPVCHFATGFWAGALAAAAGLAPERVVAVEEACAAVDAEACRICVEVR